MSAIPPSTQAALDRLTQAVLAVVGLGPEALFSRARSRQVADARHLICYLGREILGLRDADLAHYLGRELSSVSYARRAIAARLQDPFTRDAVALRRLLRRFFRAFIT